MTKPGDKSNGKTAGNESRPDIDALFRHGVEIDRAMLRASRNAMRMHKLLGHSIPVWSNGRVVWIPPDEIQVEESGPSENRGTPP